MSRGLYIVQYCIACTSKKSQRYYFHFVLIFCTRTGSLSESIFRITLAGLSTTARPARQNKRANSYSASGSPDYSSLQDYPGELRRVGAGSVPTACAHPIKVGKMSRNQQVGVHKRNVVDMERGLHCTSRSRDFWCGTAPRRQRQKEAAEEMALCRRLMLVEEVW